MPGMSTESLPSPDGSVSVTVVATSGVAIGSLKVKVRVSSALHASVDEARRVGQPDQYRPGPSVGAVVGPNDA